LMDTCKGNIMELQSHIMQPNSTNFMTALNKVTLEPPHMFGEGKPHYHV
jgi:hypothetical protein